MSDVPRMRAEDLAQLLGADMAEDKATGHAMINVALALIREVKQDVAAVRTSVEAIANERREEAYEKGKQDQRLDSLEARLDAHDAQHAKMRTWFLGVVGPILVALTIGLAILVVRAMTIHPEMRP